MNKKTKLLLLSSVLFLSSCYSYTDAMKDVFQNALGSDANGFHFYSYPTDNYGILTSYELDNDQEPSISNRLCDAWACIGIDYHDIPKDIVELKYINGFISVGGGAPITIEDNDSKKIGLHLAVPLIKNAIGFNSNIDYTKGVTTTLTFKKGVFRSINKEKWYDYLSKQNSSITIKNALKNHTLSLTVADIILEDLSASVCVDQSINPALNTELNSKISMLSSNIDISSSVSPSPASKPITLDLTSQITSSGCYTIKAEKPLIVAVYTVKQKFSNFQDYINTRKTSIPEPTPFQEAMNTPSPVATPIQSVLNTPSPVATPIQITLNTPSPVATPIQSVLNTPSPVVTPILTSSEGIITINNLTDEANKLKTEWNEESIDSNKTEDKINPEEPTNVPKGLVF